MKMKMGFEKSSGKWLKWGWGREDNLYALGCIELNYNGLIQRGTIFRGHPPIIQSVLTLFPNSPSSSISLTRTLCSLVSLLRPCFQKPSPFFSSVQYPALFVKSESTKFTTKSHSHSHSRKKSVQLQRNRKAFGWSCRLVFHYSISISYPMLL